MKFLINGKEEELKFGVKFAAELDEKELYKAESIEFGMGLMITEEKLSMGSLGALSNVIECALHRESVTRDEVLEALDTYADDEKLEDLFTKIEHELKNSNAVRAVKLRMEKANTEANRKLAVKPTKK